MSANTAEARSAALKGPWWAILIEGIVLTVIGLLLLVNPAETSVIVVQALGLYWLVAGILALVGIFIDSAQWGAKLIIGILGIIAGFIVLQHPLWSTAIVASTVVILLGIGGLIMGGANIIRGIRGDGWGAAILGLVSILLGAALLTNRLFFTLSLPWVVGVIAIAGGLATIVAAFRQRPA
jgi:uncharacterized membrane protein HdeD (DUF308 family)